jgi:hypothetical protein
MANEAISASSDGLNEDRSFRRFSQRVTQPPYCGVQTVIEVYEGVGRPELVAQLLPGNQFSRLFK